MAPDVSVMRPLARRTADNCVARKWAAEVLMKRGRVEDFAFAGRIAQVIDGTRFEGYLHVTVPELVKSPRAGGTTYVDMVFARRDENEPDHWRYEDRSDPGTDSAQEELASARLDWYGEQFELRWLDSEAAAKVHVEVFHGGSEHA
ncbi:hypothetical protein MUY14_09265 [Amycolatopsis sp. FBCC-B4732]|uniref:hypothetical protein n=1 Tax=Amycolatopsis sp. FBCC-B4732 TaxID=3079339 RepID=UPI001FF4B5E3|nr:hypothetical protein [Amycolatopsis sp. FBCC-B4732]UOX90794.1 hypothetical protein MUY14_09265 [Amycolatopsis sp. FBCC-B4732]